MDSRSLVQQFGTPNTQKPVLQVKTNKYVAAPITKKILNTLFSFLHTVLA